MVPSVALGLTGAILEWCAYFWPASPSHTVWAGGVGRCAHGAVDETDGASEPLTLVGERRPVIIQQGLALLCACSDEAPDLFQGESRLLCASHRRGPAEVFRAITTVPEGVSRRLQDPLILPVP